MRIKLLSGLFILTGLISIKLHAQDREYALNTVKILADRRYHGRGYNYDGVNKAAKYLVAEFKANGALPVAGDRFEQPFLYSVNTFPKAVHLSVNGKKLRCGVDFIPLSSSGPYTGNATLQKQASGRFITNDNRLKIMLADKLTFSESEKQDSVATLVITKKAITANVLEARVKLPALEQTQGAANITGIIKGTANTDSSVLITAHYDHLGSIGRRVYFPGGNDNASGTALLLDLMRYFKHHPAKNNIIFVAFAGEEAGLLGSGYFVEKGNSIALDKIKGVINLDLMGNGDKGITLVNGTDNNPAADAVKKAVQLTSFSLPVNLRPNRANSDHYPFSVKGIPAVFIYTNGGTPFYHDVFDTGNNVPYPAYNEIFMLIANAVTQL